MNRNANRRDAKAMTRNRFARLDADITSQYEDDETPSTYSQSSRNSRGSLNTVARHLTGTTMHNKPNNYNRGTRVTVRDHLNRGGAGGAEKFKEMVYKIKILYGRKFTIMWILKQIAQQIEDFKPILPQVTERGEVIFFIKDDDSAESIIACSRRIVHKPTGDRMVIIGEKTVAPWQKLKKEEIDVINAVVDSRYNPESRALDLSEFYMDPQFRSNNMHMMLNKNNVMLTVVDRIDEKYGHVTALSLQGNRLRLLDYTNMLVFVTKFVKVLDLSNNQIDKMEQFEKLKGLPVETLFMEGNPICEQLTKITDYLSAVHRVFPKVTMLDSMPVQASTHVLDLYEEALQKEPVPKPSFVPAHVQPLIAQFVAEYFKAYDGENPSSDRKSLIAAYDESDSTFTLTLCNLRDIKSAQHKDVNMFKQYLYQSHNIVQVEKWDKRRAERIHKGAMDIVVALRKLPRTNHYSESFVLDVSLITDRLMMFSVQGLFEDGTPALPGMLPYLNYFQRQFVVAPRGQNSLVIISDMLYISAINPERVARYKSLLNRSNSNKMSEQPATVSALIGQMDGTNVATGIALPDDETKKQMVLQFCQDSGMKPEWSEKCLVDSEWNYQAAGEAFLQAKEMIPKEAFS